MEKIGFKIDDCRTYTINEILERVSKPVNVERDKEYSQIGIRSFGKGLFYKESVTGEELGNKSVFWIEPDCFILNIVFAWEQAIGKTTQKELGMIASHRFPMYRPNLSKVDLDYLIYFFLTKIGKEILELSSPGGAGRNKTLGQDIFLNSSITLPPLSVQKLNGLILAKIDSLIQAKTQKLENLKSVKKSLLQKCFPKDGEKVPQMRFEGFSGDWEEKKLGDLIDEINERTSNFNNYELFSLTIENGVTKKTERYERGFLVTKDEDLFKIVHTNNFVTNPMNFRFGAIGYSKETKDISVSGYYDVFSIENNTSSSFWYYYFKTDSSLKRFDDVATGSLIEKRRVKLSTLKQMSFLCPSKDEKIKLGEFFSKYDSLISLHQKEIDNLKTIKKSLLQKMFV